MRDDVLFVCSKERKYLGKDSCELAFFNRFFAMPFLRESAGCCVDFFAFVLVGYPSEETRNAPLKKAQNSPSDESCDCLGSSKTVFWALKSLNFRLIQQLREQEKVGRGLRRPCLRSHLD